MSGRAPAGADRFAPTAVTVVLVVAMLAAAMIPWWPIYESPAFFLAAGAAILIGSAIGVVGARRRWPAWGVVVSVGVAYLVVGVPVAVPDRALFGVLPTPAGIVELVAGAALSWKQLVTIAVPVGSYQALLVPPFLLGLICATLAVTIALRSRYPAAAALPPALLFVAGIALGVVHVGIALQAGLMFLVAVVGWLVRVAIAKRRAITRVRRAEGAVADARRVLGASVLVAVALVGATAASIAMPGPHRSVVRAGRQPRHLEHHPVCDLVAERRAESGERAVVLVRLERRLQLGADDAPMRPRHGDRGGGRPDEGDGDEHGCPENAPRVGDGPVDPSDAGDRTALRDRDPHEPRDDRDEEDQALSLIHI